MFLTKVIIKRINSSDLSRRLFHGSFWSLFGAITGRVITLISYIWIARLLGQNMYGEFGILRSTISMFMVLAGMGIGATASKYIAQYRNSDPDYAGEIYALSNLVTVIGGGLFVLILVFFSPYIAQYSLHNIQLSSEIKLSAAVLFFVTLNSAQSGTLAGFENFKSIAINTLVSCALQGVCMVVGCYYLKISGVLIGWGVGCFVLWLLNNRCIVKQLDKYNVKYKLRAINKKTFNVLWRFSLPATLSSLMVVPVLWWAKTYLISRSGYSEMAVFDVADQWSMMVLFIPTALAQIILPLLSNTLEEGTSDQYLKLIKMNILINAFITFLLSVGVCLLGRYIMGLYGNGFVDIETLTLMMIASMAMSVCNVVGQVIASYGRMWLGFLFNFCWGIMLFLFSLLFIKDMGAKGLALAITCSYILFFVIQLIYIVKVIFRKQTI